MRPLSVLAAGALLLLLMFIYTVTEQGRRHRAAMRMVNNRGN